MSTPHYEATLQALGGHPPTIDPPPHQPHTRTQLHHDLAEWAATLLVALLCAAAVIYTFHIGGWVAAATATALITTAASIGARAAQ